MASIDDGGVKNVTYYVKDGQIHIRAVSEHYSSEEYYIEIDYKSFEDPRTTIEDYFESISMKPTWSWGGHVGSFAHERNTKCSDSFRYRG